MEKSERWVVRYSHREMSFKDKKREEGPKVRNKTAQIRFFFGRRLGTTEETRRGSCHKRSSKLSLEQVHEKQRLETPERAIKYLYSVRQVAFGLSQICKEVQKPYCGMGLG